MCLHMLPEEIPVYMLSGRSSASQEMKEPQFVVQEIRKLTNDDLL
jgi:hypothetical protein